MTAGLVFLAVALGYSVGLRERNRRQEAFKRGHLLTARDLRRWQYWSHGTHHGGLVTFKSEGKYHDPK